MNKNYCDCSQGRFACTCAATGPTVADLIAQGYLKPPADVYEAIGDGIADDTAAVQAHFNKSYAGDAAVRRGRELALTWVELNAVKWKLRIVETLAIIGWAGLILTQLGVL